MRNWCRPSNSPTAKAVRRALFLSCYGNREAKQRPGFQTNKRDACALRNLLRQLVEIFDKRHRCAIEILNLRIRGFDDVIFVRRMRAAAVAESKMSCRQ